MILKEILQKHFSDNICVFYKFILIIVEVFSGINFYIYAFIYTYIYTLTFAILH